jgi:hypothetical protein
MALSPNLQLHMSFTIHGSSAATWYSLGYKDRFQRVSLNLHYGSTTLTLFGRIWKTGFSWRCLQQGNLDISNYFTKLTSLSEQIDSYRPTCDCICAIQCTCGAATDLRKYKEQDKVIKFLKGLNEQFSHVHSQIMLLDPLPSLDRTFSLVLIWVKKDNLVISFLLT